MSETVINQAQLASVLGDLSKSTPTSPCEGFFGPQSLFWQINRHSVIFLGAGCAALLQLAHPVVAHGIFDHSRVKDAPYQRFINTFIPVFKLVYGSQATALKTCQKIHTVHAKISGTISGTMTHQQRYYANDVNGLIWVYTTLTATAITIYEWTVSPLKLEEKEHYYQESKRFAALFGISIDTLPKHWCDFMNYYQDMVEHTLNVTPQALSIAKTLLTPRSRFLTPFSQYYQELTSLLLPTPINVNFHLPRVNNVRAASIKKHVKYIGRLARSLPASLNYVPAYNEAIARIHQRKVSWTIRRYNQLIFKQANIANEE